MDTMTPASRAAERLLAEKEELATSITRVMYDEAPGLLERYGAVGRTRCLEDMRYNLEHLAPAVELEKPEMFAGYVRWLNDLLTARAVSTDHVIDSLNVTLRIIGERFPASENAAVEPCLRAGLAVLRNHEQGG